MILLRLAALAVLMLLLLNPAWESPARAGPPLVLLDRSLSMSAASEATARGLAGSAGTILAVGDDVLPLDSSPHPHGTSRIVPALVRAAAWNGPVTLVTDGEVDDATEVAPELLARVGVTLTPRDTLPSAALLEVSVPTRVAARDTVRVRLVVGVWGERPLGRAAVSIVGEDGLLAGASVALPPPGATARHEVAFPAARLRAGMQAVTIRIDAGPGDREPRDDVRVRVITQSPLPEVVVLAAPADWEARFLATILRQILEAPARAFVRVRSSEWRDAETLVPVSADLVRDAARRAAVVVWRGREGSEPPALPERGALLRWPWPPAGGTDDWYVSAPPPSPIAAGLTGVRWDSLPPLAALVRIAPEGTSWVALTARRARRGDERPILVAREATGRREIVIAASGLWSWAFRGGQEAQAYRTVLSAALNWLLGDRVTVGDAVEPVRRVVPIATPLVFVRKDTTLDAVPITLSGPDQTVLDTLRFGPGHIAAVSLAPGTYRYTLGRGAGRGIVAVEPYSDEYRPRPVVLTERAPRAALATVSRTVRAHPWLFAVLVALLAAEWAWRRRRGLP